MSKRRSKSIAAVLLGTVLAAASLSVPAYAEDFAAEQTVITTDKGTTEQPEEGVSEAEETVMEKLDGEDQTGFSETENPSGEYQTDSPETENPFENEENCTAENSAPTGSLPVGKDLVYTGEAQELLDAGCFPEDQFRYSQDGESYSTEIPEAVNAGDYTVYIKDAADPEKEAAVVTETIKKADVVFTAPVPAA